MALGVTLGNASRVARTVGVREARGRVGLGVRSEGNKGVGVDVGASPVPAETGVGAVRLAVGDLRGVCAGKSVGRLSSSRLPESSASGVALEGNICGGSGNHGDGVGVNVDGELVCGV